MKIPYVNALDGNTQQARKILARPDHKTIIVNPDLCMGTDTNSAIPLTHNHKQGANCICADELQLGTDTNAD